MVFIRTLFCGLGGALLGIIALWILSIVMGATVPFSDLLFSDNGFFFVAIGFFLGMGLGKVLS